MNDQYKFCGDSAIICFDAEMVGEQRLVELSIYNSCEQEIYHSYYNPGNVREWREEIHHISREMVNDAPKFNSVRGDVQRIVDSADVIVGCALKNDIYALTRHGVRGLADKTRIEIQDWHWLLYGSDSGESLYRSHSLLSISQELGVEFTEDEAHGASADTRATIRCFHVLKQEFEKRYFAGEERSVREIIERYNLEFERKRYDFLRGEAAGYVQLLSHGSGVYSMKFNQHVAHRNVKSVEIIQVSDRFIAEMELKKLFGKKQIRDNPDMFRLGPKDIEQFKSYSNEFDEERSSFCKQFTSGRLNRLGGNLRVTF